MIPLERKESVLNKYNAWYGLNKDRLESHFDGYLEKTKKGWVVGALKKDIKRFLLDTSPAKCVFCERDPNEGGGYLEIDHYYPKGLSEFRSKVFRLENLSFSCSQCNKAKGTRYRGEGGVEFLDVFTERSMGVHLLLNLDDMRLSGKSESGKFTVSILNSPLNAPKFLQDDEICEGAIHLRREVSRAVDEKLGVMVEYHHDPEFLYSELRGLLELIDKEKSLTAARATVLLNHPDFFKLLNRLKESLPIKHSQLVHLVQSKQQYTLSSFPAKNFAKLL